MKKFLLFFYLIASCTAFSFNPINRSQLLKNIVGTTIISVNTILSNKEEAKATDVSYVIERKANNIKFYGSLDISSCLELSDTIEESIIENKNIQLLFGLEQPPPIRLYIQSEGGQVLPTLNLVDKIKNSDIPIYSIIDGFAASSATLLSVVCTKRYMNKNSFMLLHKLSGNIQGKYADIQTDMENMDKFMNTIKNIYIENSKISLNEIDGVLTDDNWIDAKECLRLGIIDEII